MDRRCKLRKAGSALLLAVHHQNGPRRPWSAAPGAGSITPGSELQLILMKPGRFSMRGTSKLMFTSLLRSNLFAAFTL